MTNGSCCRRHCHRTSCWPRPWLATVSLHSGGDGEGREKDKSELEVLSRTDPVGEWLMVGRLRMKREVGGIERGKRTTGGKNINCLGGGERGEQLEPWDRVGVAVDGSMGWMGQWDGWDGMERALRRRLLCTDCVRCLACSRATHSSSCTPSLISSLSSLSKSLSVDIHVRQGCDAGRARTGSRGSVASGAARAAQALSLSVIAGSRPHRSVAVLVFWAVGIARILHVAANQRHESTPSHPIRRIIRQQKGCV